MRIISGKAKGKKILMPPNKKTRPLKDMVRGSIFNILDHSSLLKKNFEECNVLDLFSGIGSFGLEAISRGAKKVIFFENYQPAVNLLKKNINKLDFNKESEIKLKNIYNENSLKKINSKINLVFIDPPFKDQNLNLVLNNVKHSKILSSNNLIIIHRHKKADDKLNDDFKFLRSELYGISKIIFGKINF